MNQSIKSLNDGEQQMNAPDFWSITMINGKYNFDTNWHF